MSLAVVRAVEAALDESADGPAARAWLGTAVAPALRLAADFAPWPACRLPLTVTLALGGDEALATRLAAACVLFYAGADVTDDAQDGDLAPEAFTGWPAAVNAGNALSFLAMQTAPEVAAAFARAGLAMALGQRRDLAQRGQLSSALTEADCLACLRGKSGGSLALFASVGALALGQAEAAAALAAFGEALGMALQLASDLDDLRAPDSRDRRNQVLTLPVLTAWRQLPKRDRPHLEAAWRGEPDAPALGFLLDHSGASAYADARTSALHAEARMALATLPAGLAHDMAMLADAAASARPGRFA